MSSLMDEYAFQAVWPASARQKVIEFWQREGALSQGRAVERAEQLLGVYEDANHDVVAVSTAFPSFVRSLGLKCFYFRAFVGRAYRAQGLRSSKVIFHLVRKSYDLLNARFQQGIDPDVVGLYMEVENPSIKRRLNHLVWKDDGANIVFVGKVYDRHARVWYFDNARI